MMEKDFEYNIKSKKSPKKGVVGLTPLKKKEPGPKYHQTNREILLQLSKDMKDVKSRLINVEQNQQKDHQLLIDIIKLNDLKTK